MGKITEKSKRQIHHEMTIGDYISDMKKNFNQYKLGTDAPLMNQHVKTQISVSYVDLKTDLFDTIIGSTICAPAWPTYSKSIRVSSDEGVEFRHYTNISRFIGKKQKEEMQMHLNNLVEEHLDNGKITAVVAGYPVSFLPGRVFKKDISYFILAYEKDDNMIWMNKGA